VIFNGKKGQSHPHTWEFAIELLVDKDKFIMFLDFEKAIDDFFGAFPGQAS
jgi:6-pyruvoyltetrahydropterin/6-carboxytetrahydropterin synthase